MTSILDVVNAVTHLTVCLLVLLQGRLLTECPAALLAQVRLGARVQVYVVLQKAVERETPATSVTRVVPYLVLQSHFHFRVRKFVLLRLMGL